ncbi:GerMN domain-containing protein [Candidatus Hydrogenedentota bacterium]
MANKRKEMNPTLKLALVFLWVTLVVGLFLAGVTLLDRLRKTGSPFSYTTDVGEPPRITREKVMPLYFATSDGQALGRESRPISVSGDVSHDIHQVVSALVEGPRQTGLSPTLPPETVLLSSYVIDSGCVVLDFDYQLSYKQPGGAAAELLTIYSLVNTLTSNFKDIETMQVLIAGKEIETLAGHIDCRAVFKRESDWIR